MAVDLLSWPEVRDAEAALAAARQAQAEAQRRYRCAPHGEVGSRLSALREAVQTCLRAEIALMRRREAAGD